MRVSLLSVMWLVLRTVMPVVSTGGSLASGSAITVAPVVGAGEIVMEPAAYPPTRRIG